MVRLQFKGSPFYVRTQPTSNILCIINAKTSTILPFLKCCNHGCLWLLIVCLFCFVVCCGSCCCGRGHPRRGHGTKRRGMLMLRGSNQTTVKDLATGGSQGGI